MIPSLSKRASRLYILSLLLAGAGLLWYVSGLAVIPDGAEYRHTGIIFEDTRFRLPWFPLDAAGEHSWEFRNLDFPGPEAHLSILTTCPQSFDYWRLPLEVSVQLFDGAGRKIYDYAGNFTNVFWEQGDEGFRREGKNRRWVAHPEIGKYGIIKQGFDEQFTPASNMAFYAGYGGEHSHVPISRRGNYRIHIEVRPLGPLPAGFRGRLSLEGSWK